ncbi:unnamed protein product [Blepharisma stoltei]|uniref:DUF4378 domain-containing protein n=1 Tax=Blepharisma stoltei TaxID=1481888 RepID=A0AAU9K263_9CILI|nr:unnamed protein product [Blepharisma stoltei]
MTQVLNLSADQSQLLSPVSFLGQSMCFLDVSTTYRSGGMGRAPSAPVTGKKIQSQNNISRPDNDNNPRFPVPVQIYTKAKRTAKSAERKLADISNLPSRPKSNLKTEKKPVKNPPKPPIHPSKINPKNLKDFTHPKKSPKKSSTPKKTPKKAEINKAVNKSFSVQIKQEYKNENSFIIQEKSEKPRNSSKVKEIVKQTLKKEKIKKVKKEKEEKEMKEMLERKKKDIQNQNYQIRYENSIRFRKEKFKPKIAWGANEKKILGTGMTKLQREIAEQRKQVREQRERAKSAGRARIGLDTLTELQIELGYQPRSLSVSQEIIQMNNKPDRKPNIHIKEYIKTQKKTRKEFKEIEKYHHQAEEVKRINQLKQLDIYSKFNINKFQKKKKKALKHKKRTPKKSYDENIEETSKSDSEIKTSEKHQIHQFVYDITENSEDEHLDQSDNVTFSMYDHENSAEHTIKSDNESYSLNGSHKSNKIPNKNFEFIHSGSEGSFDFQDSDKLKSSVELKKEDIKKRMLDLKLRIGKVKDNLREPSPETINKAVVKIQSHIRRFLVQRRLLKDINDFSDEDKEVQNILRLSQEPKQRKKELAIEIDEDYDVTSEEEQEPLENEEEILQMPTSKLNTVELEGRLNDELKNLEDVKQKGKEYREVLKEQLIWQESQMQNLEFLKQKELKELKEITQKLGQGKELEGMLAGIIESRYTHLASLLVENIENVQEVLVKDLDETGRKELEDELEERMNQYSENELFFEDQRSESEEDNTFVGIDSGKIDRFIKNDPLNPRPGYYGRGLDTDSLKPGELEQIMKDIKSGAIDSEESEEDRPKTYEVHNENQLKQISEEKKEEATFEAEPEETEEPAGIEQDHHDSYNQSPNPSDQSPQVSIRTYESPESVKSEKLEESSSSEMIKNVINKESFKKFERDFFANLKNQDDFTPDSNSPHFEESDKPESPDFHNSTPEKIKTDRSDPDILIDLESYNGSHSSTESHNEIVSDLEQHLSEPESSIEVENKNFYQLRPQISVPHLDIPKNEENNSGASSAEMKQISPFAGFAADFIQKKKFNQESPPVSSSSRGHIYIDEGKSPEFNSPRNEDSFINERLNVSSPDVPSRTPDNIPDRPSAPFQELDSEEEKTPTHMPLPSFGNEELNWKPKKIDAKSYDSMTPELVNSISEEILKSLLSEDILPRSSPKSSLPLMPILDLKNLSGKNEITSSLSAEPIIQTDHRAVRKYADEVFETAIKNIDEVYQNLKKPLRRNPLDMLAKMQETEIGTPVENEFLTYPPILSLKLYLSLEHPKEIESSRKNLSPNTIQLMSEAEHIHNKMIFDAINEGLQKYRPYSLKGVPMPWSNSIRYLSNETMDPNKAIQEVKEEVESWSMTQAGKMPTGDMVLSSGIVDEEYMQQVREERLASMLAEEVLERDEVWVDYEFEETQAKLDLADMILEGLVIETIDILKSC